MIYNVKLNDDLMSTLLSIIKFDFDYAYDDGDEPDINAMRQDIELLRSISYAFTNEDARLCLETIIAGYEKDLRSVT